MPRFLSLAILGLFICSSSFLRAQCFELVWADEFDVNGPPNPEYWGYDLGTGQNGWGNNEIQAYTSNSQNVRVADGKLIIDALKQNNVWTSARVKSQGKKSFEYGKIQFRAKLPAGSGTWPALWMLGNDITSVGWPACGEIDVMEHVGREPGRVHGSLHSPSSFGATVNTGTTIVSDFAGAFHDYEAIWTEESITFLVDGNAYYTYAPSFQNQNTWPFDGEFFIIMNIAMGGTFGGDNQYPTGVDPNLSSARMEVDHVRIYQEVQGVALTGAQNVAPYATGLTYTLAGLQEGTFNWTVPPGATITSGQNTPTITVTWGETPGEVSVEAVGLCNTYTASLFVDNIIVPQGPSYILDDFEDGNHNRWLPDPGDGNSFTFTESEGALKIAYNVTSPAQNPRAVLQLDRPVDLSTYSKMRVRARTFNTSGTVNMRIDLFDQEGTATNASPVFKLEPLVDDGEYAIYEYDFSGDWQSSFPNAGAFVDSTRITGLNLYINYGLFGSAGSDELWLDYIEMVDPEGVNGLSEVLQGAGFEVYPNPAQNTLTLRMDMPYGQLPALECHLYNLKGEALAFRHWAHPADTLQLDVSGFAAGVYVLVLRAGREVMAKKMIIE